MKRTIAAVLLPAALIAGCASSGYSQEDLDAAVGEALVRSSETSTTASSTSTTESQHLVQFLIVVSDYFDWDPQANLEGDRCVATDDFLHIRSGATLIIRDLESQRIVATGRLGDGTMWIEPGLEDLPDDDLDLFWGCMFWTEFDANSLDPNGVYEVGVQDDLYTFTGADLLAEASPLAFYAVELESRREAFRLTMSRTTG